MKDFAKPLPPSLLHPKPPFPWLQLTRGILAAMLIFGLVCYVLAVRHGGTL